MSRKRNFIQNCLNGEYLSDDLFDEFANAVEEWHGADTDKKVFEYLGMTKDQYELIVEKPVAIHYVIYANEHRMDVTQAVNHLRGSQLAARGCDSKSGMIILKWLKKKGKI